jgi:hypothetical protein
MEFKMTVDDFVKTLEEYHDGEFCNFRFMPEEDQLSKRPDVHAIMLLDSLTDDCADMLSGRCPTDDVISIFLNVNVEEVAANITHKQCVELVRCGVYVQNELLYLFI